MRNLERGPDIPGPELTREHEQTLERKKEANMEEIIGRYVEKAQFDEKTRGDIEQILNQETEQRYIEFAEEWFRKNRKKIENAGYNPNKKEKAHIMKVVEIMGGFKELEGTEKDQEIYHLKILEQELGKENVPLDSQYLMLNVLNRRAKRIETEISRARDEKTNEVKVAEKQKELDDLFELRKQVAEKITGENLLTQEEINEIKDEATKEIEEMFASTPKGIKRIFDPRKGKQREQAIAEIGNKAKEKTRGKLEQKIREIGQSPEKAIGGIEAVYERVRGRVAIEYAANKIKGEKTPEQLKDISKEFKRRGIDPVKIITEGSKCLEDDPDAFKGLLGRYGIEADAEKVQELQEKGKEKNPLDLFLFIIWSLLEEAKK